MKLWIDCEFNSFEGQLLSMALVDEDDCVFYRELEIYENLDSWVVDNVVLDWPDRKRTVISHFNQNSHITLWPTFERCAISTTKSTESTYN